MKVFRAGNPSSFFSSILRRLLVEKNWREVFCILVQRSRDNPWMSMVYKINQINLNINQNWRTQLLDDDSFGVIN
jgi:hypothetical protein